MPVSREVLDTLALGEEEYNLIVERLGREPTEVELGMFGSLWSEHCGYKHSKLLLRLFPTTGRRVLTRIGEENAGAVDLGGGLCLVMKIESHNHPSAIEPFQGAATGVGGIVRDIFTMGAYPIALLNSLRFGPLEEPRNRYLLNGIVGGIAAYGNCLGIPDVGGEVYFSSTYSGNPLVNAMCVGIARTDHLVGAGAGSSGNSLILVGADTGRDGLHGASGLASRTFEDNRELRPTVQVGNPFLEKLLIEACFELAQTDWIVGMQDLGAAGLTSSVVECAARTGSGIDIDVAHVPRREEGMTPYEVMLSESQERMLVVAKRGYEDKVRELFHRWELRSDIIGEVTDDGIARIRDGGRIVAEASIEALTTPPLYRVPCRKPAWLRRLQHLDLGAIPDLSPTECNAALLKLLASPNITSKEWIYRQYDHQVQCNTVIPPRCDAAVLRIKLRAVEYHLSTISRLAEYTSSLALPLVEECEKGIALTTDGSGRYCYLDPYSGGAIAVAEAARNLSCVGATPVALTDCLNFGNPEDADVYYQLKECIRGMVRACRVLKIPVVSGNVSLYNESYGSAIYPTPVVGMAGLLSDVRRHCTMDFKDEGDVVFLLGDDREGCLDGSEYLEVQHGVVRGRPSIDLNLEKRVQGCCCHLIESGVIKSAHDCSEGGLAVTLAECCIGGNRGFQGEIVRGKRNDASLFGELQSRIIISTMPGRVRMVEEVAAQMRVPLTRLGIVVGCGKIVIDGLINLPLKS